ncbi:hypothetical protein LY625_06520 [Lysobacter sp. GX 14042]|uniref:glycosyltransferase family 9 protein n=1 Tax=Lysobacter sp. GX 14042 TaxID=2907155 RepID=UPI001F261A72|nr:hypothetical protein [Lysobacter sp. GX 14042]MCE7032275.1 hypothetical protein [Lysobacter sp. GX 14042]
MRRGEWEQAWQVGDAGLPARAARPCHHLPRHLQYVWTGAPLEGRRVLVRCYHGLGDTLQFIRYVPLLAQRAAEVAVWAQPGLLPLLAQVPGIDRLLPLHDGDAEVDYDVDVELMELAHVFRSTPDDLPGRVPYLHAEPHGLPGPDVRPRIGLVWRGGDWNPARSMDFRQIAPLAGLPGVRALIVQPQARDAGWDGCTGEYPGEFGIPAYASVLSALDLLVTIDSMPAHLGGALGVPTWVLLHHEPDWRWMEGRDDSPWYPGMRLFRQRAAGDWAGVVDQVMAALAAHGFASPHSRA